MVEKKTPKKAASRKGYRAAEQARDFAQTKREAFKAKLKQNIDSAKPVVKQTATAKLPHLIIKAGAGTGKSTTITNGVKVMFGDKPEINPSVQQAEIWSAMISRKRATTLEAIRLLKRDEEFLDVRFCAFNKSIATELSGKLPVGVQASTNHSLGFSILRNDDRFRGVKTDSWKTEKIIEEITGVDIRDFYKQKPQIPANHVKRLVSLCKQNLVMPTDPAFTDLADGLLDHHQIDVDKQRETVIKLSQEVLTRAMTFLKKGNREYMPDIDFDDMIWLPVALDLPVEKVDLLLVDESQDLNRCQQELLLRSAERLILVGDENQAIYGFAGADADSMNRMEQYLASTDRGVVVLPLTETRRCGHAIVKEANAIVPTLTAHESNPAGEVIKLSSFKLMDTVRDDEMLVCRVNAPLVSTCFRFLKAGRKARIQGRDIGQGLISTIRKMNADDMEQLLEKLETWHQKEVEKQLKKKFGSEAAMIALEDRYACLVQFAEDSDSPEDMIATIERVFTDSGSGILLSSVHRAKGLEAGTVYILCPELMPHKMAKSEWQVQQEMNLKYVAITRAINRLVYVINDQQGGGQTVRGVIQQIADKHGIDDESDE